MRALSEASVKILQQRIVINAISLSMSFTISIPAQEKQEKQRHTFTPTCQKLKKCNLFIKRAFEKYSSTV